MPVADGSSSAAPLADVLDDIRNWIGDQTPPTDNDLAVLWDRHPTVEQVALFVLRKRRASLLTNPAAFTVQGDYSQSTVKNLDALNALIGQLEQITGEGQHVVSAGRIVRVGASRRLPAHRRWR